MHSRTISSSWNFSLLNCSWQVVLIRSGFCWLKLLFSVQCSPPKPQFLFSCGQPSCYGPSYPVRTPFACYCSGNCLPRLPWERVNRNFGRQFWFLGGNLTDLRDKFGRKETRTGTHTSLLSWPHAPELNPPIVRSGHVAMSARLAF